MKIYQASYDTISTTFILEDGESPIDFLLAEDEDYKIIDGVLNYSWDNTHHDIVNISEMTNKRGVIHYESH